MIPLFSRVRLTSDEHRDQGAPRGTEGTVIEDYGDGGYEIEVSAPDGTTLALFSAQEHDVEVIGS